jgi:hypothetical protein
MTRLKWAPRVPMEWLLRLYEQDAKGIIDSELIDKVGYRLFERCRDCIAVSEAAHGRVACPICRSKVDVRGEHENRTLRCFACGWASDWASFHKSWRHMELCSTGMHEFFDAFMSAWDRARTPQQKMLAIDEVIHRWHWENVLAERGGVGRPGGVNLIEGSRKQVIAFLDRLGVGAAHDRWAEHYEEVRNR